MVGVLGRQNFGLSGGGGRRAGPARAREAPRGFREGSARAPRGPARLREGSVRAPRGPRPRVPCGHPPPSPDCSSSLIARPYQSVLRIISGDFLLLFELLCVFLIFLLMDLFWVISCLFNYCVLLIFFSVGWVFYKII